MSESREIIDVVHELNECVFISGTDSEQWEEVLIRARDFADFETAKYSYRIGDQWTSFAGSDWFKPGNKVLHRLKRLAFESGLGSWISIRIHMFPDRDPSVEFIRNEEVMFGGRLDRPASPGTIYRELVAFPRTTENIPDWMTEKIVGSGENVPVFDPATSEIVIGEDRYPFTEPGL